jgi:hypothetical protein
VETISRLLGQLSTEPPPPVQDPTPVQSNGNGHKARHRRPPLSATEAALIAVALVNGRLTAAMACRLTGANAGYFSLVNKLSERERELLARGKLTLTELHNKRNGNGNGNGDRSGESLIEHLRRASADELRAAGRDYGVAHVFDDMIVPNLDGKGADVIVTEVKATDV